jgi:uncharacterized membrane protein YoaK (UPF0700 family)
LGERKMNIYDIAIPIVGLITLSIVVSIIVCQKNISINNTVRLCVIMGIVFAVVCLAYSRDMKPEIWTGIITLFSATIGYFARGFSELKASNTKSEKTTENKG